MAVADIAAKIERIIRDQRSARGDIEADHSTADGLLLEAIGALSITPGQRVCAHRIRTAFKAMDKWYA